MTLDKIIILARKHVVWAECEMRSSAELCLQDAMALQSKGDYENAKTRALKSLAYTVGVLHPDYRKAAV